MLGNYRMAAQVVASRAVLSSTELVSYGKSYIYEECRLLRCYAVWYLQEPHVVTSQKIAFLILTIVRTSNLT
jgi:hypothetical protein